MTVPASNRTGHKLKADFANVIHDLQGFMRRRPPGGTMAVQLFLLILRLGT